MAEERWRSVVGYEGLYEVSDQGKVRNLKTGKILRQFKDSWGYAKVNLRKDKMDKPKLVHILVAEAFIRLKRSGEVVCHGPSGQTDNSLSNLYYSTQSRNTKEDKRRDGTANIGDAHPCAKLSEEKALEILSLKGKMLQVEIALNYGVSRALVSAIHRGTKWAHLQSEEGRAMAAHATRNAIKRLSQQHLG